MRTPTLEDNKPLELISFGEVLVDEINGPSETHTLLGGSPSNVAVHLTRLGHSVQLIAATGQDAAGQFIRQELHRYLVDDRHIQLSSLPTSQVTMNQTAQTPVASFKRGADCDIQLNRALIDLVQTTKIFHFSYWPLSNISAKTTLLTLVEHAKHSGALIGFDPNYHPAIQTEESLHFHELEALLQRVDVIKPSLDDAKRMFGALESPEAYLTRFESYDIPIIVLTLGQDGLIVSHDKTRKHYPAHPVDVIDATGAGDALMSGFYHGILQQSSMEEALLKGQSFSHLVLKTLGAIPKQMPKNL